MEHLAMLVVGVGEATPPLPIGRGLSALTPQGAKRLRRLGRKGEGPDLCRYSQAECLQSFGRAPHPFFPKLAFGSLRKKALSQSGEGAFASRISFIVDH